MKRPFRNIIRSGLSSNDEEIVMTLAEKYRQKGKLEALQETALNLIKLGVNIEKVSQVTKLPLQEIQDLWSQNTSTH